MAQIAKKTKRYPSDLTDEEWDRIAPLMPKPGRRGRPREVDFREVINAVRYLVRSGCGWRMLLIHFGAWQTVYGWFRELARRFLFQTIHDIELMLDRERQEREASPSAGVIDSQSVKAPSAEKRGFDAGKKVVGRKRHIAVDTDGRLLMVNLTTADISDSAGAQTILDGIRKRWPWIKHLFADGAYDRLKLMDKASYLDFVVEVIRRSDQQQGQGSAPTMGRRADLWLDDPMAPIGPRLREAHRRLAGHDTSRQPMGFYAPAQIVRDARNHGVDVRPVSINHSHWDCTLEKMRGRYMAVRLGFRSVRGLANAHGAAIVAAHGPAPYESVEDVWRRAKVPRAAIERLAEADAFHCLAQDRRQGLWKVKGLGEAPLPLFAAADARAGHFSAEGQEPDVTLTPMSAGREVVEDYRSTQLSLRGHPLQFLRAELDAMRIVRCGDLPSIRDGSNVELAGVILVRQRPGSAKGVLFVTIEDETGVAQGILWPDRFEIYRRQVMSASMIAMRGRLQKEGEVIHIICDRIVDHDAMLRSIGRMEFTVAPGRGDGASHGGGPDPRDPAFLSGRTLSPPPFTTRAPQDELLPIRSHDFH